MLALHPNAFDLHRNLPLHRYTSTHVMQLGSGSLLDTSTLEERSLSRRTSLKAFYRFVEMFQSLIHWPSILCTNRRLERVDVHILVADGSRIEYHGFISQ